MSNILNFVSSSQDPLIVPSYLSWGNLSRTSKIINNLQEFYLNFDLNVAQFNPDSIQATTALSFLESFKFKLFRSYLDEFPIVLL